MNMNMKKTAVVCLIVFLTGCAGPVYVARNESESLKTAYQDPQLAALSAKYQGLEKEIYARYKRNNMGVSKEGLGFTSLMDNRGGKLHYLMVEIRPEEVNFDKNSTTGEQRLQLIVQRYFEPNLRVMNRQDIAPSDIDGLAFGVTWAVRDFYQCDKYGGFVEYVIAYIDKNDFNAISDGSKTAPAVLGASEVITSLNLEPPKPIKLRFQ
jgi:hypothetical protein